MWFIFALLGGALFASCNHVDKYLLSKYCTQHSPITLLIYSSAIGIFVAPFIGIIWRHQLIIPIPNILVLMFAGVIYLMALLPYLFALDDEDASLVIPVFQTIPIFNFILGFLFLGEVLYGGQIFGMILIILGAVGLTFDFTHKKRTFKWRILFLMLLASFMFACNYFFFKWATIGSSLWVGLFWEYVGFIIPAGSLLMIHKYRKSFFGMLKSDGKKVVGLNIFNEVLNTLAVFAVSYSLLLAPIAIASTVTNGTQPVFVFIFGVLLTIFFPKISQENLSFPIVMQKIIFIAIVVIGSFYLNL